MSQINLSHLYSSIEFTLMQFTHMAIETSPEAASEHEKILRQIRIAQRNLYVHKKEKTNEEKVEKKAKVVEKVK